MLRRLSTPGKQAVLGTTATSVGILVAGLLGGVIVARGLGPELRGQLAIYVIWGMLLQAVLGLGVPYALAFFSASEPAAQLDLWRYYRYRLMTRVSALVGAGVLLLYGGFVVVGRASVRDAVIFAAWSPLSQVSVAAASFLQGMGQFRRFNVVRIVGGVGPPAGVALLAAVGWLSVATVGIAYGLAGLLASLAGLHWLGAERSKDGTPASPCPGFWKYSLQSVTSLAAVTANGRADQFALSVLVGRADLGIYAVAASSTQVLVPLISGVSMVTFPRVASSRSVREQRLIVGRSLTAVVIASLVASVALALAAPMLIRSVFGPGYSEGARPAQALALGGVFVCCNLLLGDILRGLGRPVPVVVGEVIGSIVTLIAVVLVVEHSLTWVAIGSTLGYGLTTVCMGLALRQRLRAAG